MILLLTFYAVLAALSQTLHRRVVAAGAAQHRRTPVGKVM